MDEVDTIDAARDGARDGTAVGTSSVAPTMIGGRGLEKTGIEPGGRLDEGEGARVERS